MTQFLIDTFIKNNEDINNLKVRESYGTLSSLVGIVLNIILFLFKILIGTLSNSISITSDGFNNLSDCATSLITFFGFKMASKPADEEHPFGHGRMEYILSFILSLIILFVGFELIKNSVLELINPSGITFSLISVVVVLISILVKIWMSIFNNTLGKKLNNSAMLAISKDSLNDVIATSATLISLVFSSFTSLPLDGIMGIIVSLFVLKSGYEIIKDTIDELLGMTLDKEIVDKIKEIIMENEIIIGYHDLMVHNYGPGTHFGSVHVEVDSNSDFVTVHDIVDLIEKKLLEETGIMMTLHMDPINFDDEKTKYYYNKMLNIVKSIHPNNHIHDFRMVLGETHIKLIFDLVVPYNFEYKDEEIKDIISEGFKDEPNKIYIVPTIEHEYI
ncbi:MAG: cation transporter [Erysipelotrichaceae bacterium]|nr:cation transporter [Erysipelotrichaceae bacterium]